MLDESSKVGPVGERLGKRMDMIGHHAVRQKREVEQFRGFKELFDDACGQRIAGKHGATKSNARCQEIPLASDARSVI